MQAKVTEQSYIKRDANLLCEENIMFKLENVTKTYAKSTQKAIDDISLEINDGEIFGFLGPNGAGKTTTIKLLTGILSPDCGKLTIDGIDVAENPLEAKKRFSFVPDTPELFSRQKASEYLNFIGDVYEVSTVDRQKRTEEYASLFGISDVLNSKISSFSHGMKQKLFLTASLLSDPSNWILDEPMVGLDPEAAFNLKTEMRKRAENGKTVFFSTHVMEVAEKLCDRIGVIKSGHLVFVGTLEQMKKQAGSGSDASLEKIFLELVDGKVPDGEK